MTRQAASNAAFGMREKTCFNMAFENSTATIMIDPQNLSLWRTEQRKIMLDKRAKIVDSQRSLGDAMISRALTQVLASRDGILGFTHPIQAEFDARDVVTAWLKANTARRAVLPVVIKRNEPLKFRRWTPQSRMKAAGFGTQVPEEGEWLVPDALLIPLVGFDDQLYRLGYGGGYYDRTLGTLAPRPFCIGVAYEACRIETIYPQPHDIAMDMVITENAVRTQRAERAPK
jgi:5-formyltetrahydrofolate cyclo-ligase